MRYINLLKMSNLIEVWAYINLLHQLQSLLTSVLKVYAKHCASD